ncbi:hypothetical protein AR437_05135 [Christensenella hongkongensis]|nr:hypothetical protein AR437_05135 [Christensenella hongkongensis]
MFGAKYRMKKQYSGKPPYRFKYSYCLMQQPLITVLFYSNLSKGQLQAFGINCIYKRLIASFV